MKYDLTPTTFEVNEIFRPHLVKQGIYYYYTLEKKGISHKEAARRIGVKAWFCGIKDKNASTTQWFCTTEQVEETTQPDFVVKFKGMSSERIHVGKHKGNSFIVNVELSDEEQRAIKNFKSKEEFFCNYFGEQRFSEKTIDICKALEEKDFETALKLFVTMRSKFDSDKSRAIKKIIEDKWGNWEKLLCQEEIKGTGKVVLFEYLLNNPTDFEGAFLHTEETSTKILIKAAQAFRFNKKLNELAKLKKPNNLETQIAGQNLNISASKAFPRFITIDPTDFEEKLRKSSFERRTFTFAEKFKYKRTEKNDYNLSFDLSRGAYATVFLKYLDSWLKNKINKGKSTK
ncbi:MAG: tRNA pseudouridine(13) synthase TruD [archaeon]|jgi:tRNA(Glu) U13 pseudouridine synthase TruD